MSDTTTTRPLAELRLEEILERWPVTLAIFEAYGLDICCGGALPLGEAAARHGIPLQTLVEDLGHVVAGAASAGEKEVAE